MNEWILITEKLPKESTDVFVSVKDMAGKSFTVIDSFFYYECNPETDFDTITLQPVSGIHTHWRSFNRGYDVIAWQPIIFPLPL